ncbi:MAG: hypothetical protein JRH14_22655 [Deltaproteobacteria bacterium]|nr:hypothetical protein [Deltaproteobacteria bacterium]MBW2162718.1 hypothetical protein [Deltaproteobacteria bacterium]
MKNTGLWTVPALVFAVSVFGAGLGCGETGGGNAGSGGAGGSGGTAGSASPTITEVAWTWPQGDDCKVGMTSAVTLLVSATDADTDQLSLDYTGSVSDCTPDPFGGNVTEISILDCDPEAVDYTGTVTVTDPEANSDTVTFEFQPCESGTVCEGGDPCE